MARYVVGLPSNAHLVGLSARHCQRLPPPTHRLDTRRSAHRIGRRHQNNRPIRPHRPALHAQIPRRPHRRRAPHYAQKKPPRPPKIVVPTHPMRPRSLPLRHGALRPGHPNDGHRRLRPTHGVFLGHARHRHRRTAHRNPLTRRTRRGRCRLGRRIPNRNATRWRRRSHPRRIPPVERRLFHRRWRHGLHHYRHDVDHTTLPKTKHRRQFHRRYYYR